MMKSGLTLQLQYAHLLVLALRLLLLPMTQGELLNYRQIVTSEGLCWQSGSSGQQITIQTCSPLSANQFWALTPIGLNQYQLLTFDGLCADLLQQSTTLGAPVGVWKCNPDPSSGLNQVFGPSSYGSSSIQISSSGQCMELSGGGINHPTGTGITQYPCNGGKNQAFRLPPITDTSPSSNAVGSVVTSEGLCWTGDGAGNSLQLQQCDSANMAQKFAVIKFGPGISIQSTLDTTLCVLPLPSNLIGLAACQSSVSSALNQLLIPSNPVDAGVASSLYNVGTKSCFDLPGVRIHNVGTTIGQWKCNSGSNQKFFLPNSTFTQSTERTMIKAKLSPRICLAAVGGQLIGQSCNSAAPAQWWNFYLGQFVSNWTGIPLCMSFSTLSSSDGLLAGVRSCGNSGIQLFMPQNNGQLLIGSSYKCLSVGGPSSNSFVEQRKCNGSSAQAFEYSSPANVFPPISTSACGSMEQRREWRDLSNSEKVAYINAANGVLSLPSKAGRRGFYDDLVAVHASAIGYIHSTPLFFPWHRAYLRMYEKALQQIDPSVRVPYWDSGFDGQNPQANTAIFGGTSLHFGTRGPIQKPCLPNGFAKSWTTFYGRNCIQRNYTDNFVVYDNTVLGPIVTNSANFTAFSSPMEVAHNVVHFYVGGLNGSLYIIDLSVNDPLFFIHHSNVDRLWWLWQKAHPSIATQYIGTTKRPPGSSNSVEVSENDLLPGFNVPVSSTLLLNNGGQYCVEYMSYSATGGNVNARRRRAPGAGTSAVSGGSSTIRSESFIDEVKARWVGSGILGRTVERKSVGALPENWIRSMAPGGTTSNIDNSLSTDIPTAANADGSVDEILQLNVAEKASTFATHSGDEMVDRVRKGEAILQGISLQFDTELDKYLDSHLGASYEEAKQAVLNSWVWVDY